MFLTGIGAVAALVLSVPVAGGPGSDPLYGRVSTTEGEVVEGWLRWDRNEASTHDWLDALLPVPLDDVREAERLDPEFAAEQRASRTLVAFGVRLTWEEDDEADPVSVRAGLRFGHISAIIPVDARSARVELRDGGSVELRGNTTDLGRGMRALEVTDARGETHAFRWGQLERVDFLAPPSGRSPLARRLHGTVTTWSGETFTGDVAWDLDEILDDDVLDGREGRTDHAIPFRDIAAIEYEDDNSSRVLLRSGETRLLRGTNDVDEDNRGIEISDPGFGRAVVHWADFRSVRFHPPAAPDPVPPADSAAEAVTVTGGSAEVPGSGGFAPGDPFRGTVFATDGRTLEGSLRWNNARSALWQTLDGRSGDIELHVELGSVREIRKVDEDRVEVTVADGRSFVLDVEPEAGVGNAAVFVTPDGRPTRIVLWRNLDRVEVAR